jgi:hypothetical protein
MHREPSYRILQQEPGYRIKEGAGYKNLEEPGYMILKQKPN